MTGSAPDADEIVQETFTRALASPPSTGPSRNWLLSVAANLSRDHLRRRRRKAYVGAWLPSAIEAEAEPDGSNPERRYGLRESASFAFLLALEPLTSRQRAVLLLRDVFDLSVEETAAVLRMSHGALRGMHHRARAALGDYDEHRSVPDRERLDLVRSALERLASAVATGDPARVEAVLAEQATLHADGAGRFGAVRGVRGARPIARIAIFGGQRRAGVPTQTTVWENVNGAPALVVDSLPPPGADIAPRGVVSCDVNASGRITTLYVVASPEKLNALPRSEGLHLHQAHGQDQGRGDHPGQ